MRSPLAVTAALILAGCVGGAAAPTDITSAPPDSPRMIRNGSLDGDAHPHVGLMVAQDAQGTPLWRCSGTLISPRVFLTAGHCTSGAARAEIWFDADVDAGYPANGYPYDGNVDGVALTHPQFTDATYYLTDVGVIILNTPWQVASYGTLPAENALDAMANARGRQDQTFTAVGYGMQYINPVHQVEQRIRMSATPKLVQINTGYTGSTSLLLSNNNSTGGICFGDSGGPNFIGSSNVIAGITSFAKNNGCVGTGGVFRLDRREARDWVMLMLSANP